MLPILLKLILLYYLLGITQSFLSDTNRIHSNKLTYKQSPPNQVIKREITQLKLTPNDNTSTNSINKRRLYILEHVINLLKKKVIQYNNDINDLKQQVRTTNLVHYTFSIFTDFTVIILFTLFVVGRCQSKSSEI